MFSAEVGLSGCSHKFQQEMSLKSKRGILPLPYLANSRSGRGQEHSAQEPFQLLAFWQGKPPSFAYLYKICCYSWL